MNNNKIDNLLKIDYSYPDINDPDLQEKLYKKREFYYHKIPDKKELNDYDDIKDYRDNVCAKDFVLHEHQALLSNFINPDTPYKGCIVFHGLGSGKTCAGIAIAEKFKPLVQKYNTKIHILVSGPLLKESWKSHLIKCTGDTYIKQQTTNAYISNLEKERIKKLAISEALQYYRFMSYKSFYKRVLGEKIIDKTVIDGSIIKASYRKTDEGEFARDISIDRIHNLNNSLIIVDEAHNLTGNNFGNALTHIINNSVNLKVVLMSATPMKNLADSIVELINFLRPIDNQMERDKIFSSHKNYNMSIKKNGLEYFKKMASGYISHVRGLDPLIFASRVDRGIVPNGLLFTKVIQCTMSKFQKIVYDLTVQKQSENEDSLDRHSESVANFVFPCLSQNKKEIVGCYGREGMISIKNQLKTSHKLLNKNISKLLNINNNNNNNDTNNDDNNNNDNNNNDNNNNDDDNNNDDNNNDDNNDNINNNTNDANDDFIYAIQQGKYISGKIFNIKYLEMFSTKFYKALNNLNDLVEGKKGAKTAFVYSNLVEVGVNLFREILVQNGYLEYQENYSNYQINSSTVCYYCGYTYESHNNYKNVGKNKNNINNKLEYEIHEINDHKFSPAIFMVVTGKSNDDDIDNIPEEKKKILDNAFNNIENRYGKLIKFILGSKVMNEGISLENVGEVHLLDVYFNLGRVDQVVGRAIRWCSHYKLMNKNNVYPKVEVFKYVITLDNNNLSTEEELYKKAELKYMLIKKIERTMKEIAIDCPLNHQGNVFPTEIKQYSNCKHPTDDTFKTSKHPTDDTCKTCIKCPQICDFTQCNYRCNNLKLNADYYDPTRNIYKAIDKNNFDYTTFTNTLAKNEILFVKTKIKEMYIIGYIYTIDEIIKYVKDNYPEAKLIMFDVFFVYKGLDDLLPVTENDFNSFKDTIIDKNNRPGYLIYRDKYYIFQPFDQNEDVPIYYRTHYINDISQNLSLLNYLKNSPLYHDIINKNKQIHISSLQDTQHLYNFDDVMDYYNNREEYKYVGIIDKEVSKRKAKNIEDIDLFKIRDKRAKILNKKRGTGIPSLKGSVCTTKTKDYLNKVAKSLDLNVKNLYGRDDICNVIKDKMLYLEKYSTAKDKNKLTYVIVPSNHPTYKFPYNLEDRIDFIINKIKLEIKDKITVNIKSQTKNDNIIYNIYFKLDKINNDYDKIFKIFDGEKIDDKYVITVS